MGEHQNKWWDKMIEKHGSEDAVRTFMRESANKSQRNRGGSGGFASLDKKTLREIASKGGKRSKKNASNL